MTRLIKSLCLQSTNMYCSDTLRQHTCRKFENVNAVYLFKHSYHNTFSFIKKIHYCKTFELRFESKIFWSLYLFSRSPKISFRAIDIK